MRAERGSAYLGGGTTLGAGGAPAVRIVIALDGLGLGTVREGAEAIVLGATVTLQQIADLASLGASGLGILGEAARAVGNRSIRNQSTLGGHLAARRASADLVPALVVQGAHVLFVTDAGEREMPVEHYVEAPLPEALLTGVRVPRPAASARFARERFARTTTDRATVSVAIGLVLAEGTIAAPRVAIGGVAPTVVRVAGAEAALEGGRPGDEALGAKLAEAVRAQVRPVTDSSGDAAFKAHLAAELSARALARALGGTR